MSIAGDQWPQVLGQEVMQRIQNGEKLQLHVGSGRGLELRADPGM